MKGHKTTVVINRFVGDDSEFCGLLLINRELVMTRNFAHSTGDDSQISRLKFGVCKKDPVYYTISLSGKIHQLKNYI